MMDIFNEDAKGSVIKLTDLSKPYLISLAQQVVQNVHDGNADALEEFLKAKAMEEVCSAILDGLKSDAKDEASKYGNGSKLMGCTITLKNQADTYDFSDSEEWNKVVAQIAELTARKKEIEKQMIEASKFAYAVDENGEIIPQAKVKSAGGTILSVTLPK